MKIGRCRDRNPESETYQLWGEIVYSPLFEMMASMHVICNPKHHMARSAWIQRVEEEVSPELLQKIRDIGEYTNQWMIPMDIPMEEDFIELDLDEGIQELYHVPLTRWNHLFQLYNRRITRVQKQQMIVVLDEYKEQFFAKELKFLEPLIIRELRKVYEQWKEDGIASSLKKIHDRLKITDTEAIYIKDKEYHYPWKEVKIVQYTGSTFLNPHLIMGKMKDTLFVAKHFIVEQANGTPPQELIDRYAALSDATRLHILKYLKRRPETTQSLAKKLSISEAAVSKQLKLLLHAGYLAKYREGAFVYYSLEENQLEYLAFWLFEYL